MMEMRYRLYIFLRNIYLIFFFCVIFSPPSCGFCLFKECSRLGYGGPVSKRRFSFFGNNFSKSKIGVSCSPVVQVLPKPFERKVLLASKQSQPFPVKRETDPPHFVIIGAPCSGKGTICDAIRREFGAVHISTGDLLRDLLSKNGSKKESSKNGSENNPQATTSPLLEEARKAMKEGRMVPDEVVVGLVVNRLMEKDCKQMGWLLDGFPRTRGQAQLFLRALEGQNVSGEHHLLSKKYKPQEIQRWEEIQKSGENKKSEEIQKTEEIKKSEEIQKSEDIRKSLAIDYLILLDAPPDILIKRSTNRRLDPKTGKIYNLLTCPPKSEEVRKRLIRREDDMESIMRNRLYQHTNHVSKMLQLFQIKVVRIDGSRTPAHAYQQFLRILEGEVHSQGDNNSRSDETQSYENIETDYEKKKDQNIQKIHENIQRIHENVEKKNIQNKNLHQNATQTNQKTNHSSLSAVAPQNSPIKNALNLMMAPSQFVFGKMNSFFQLSSLVFADMIVGGMMTKYGPSLLKRNREISLISIFSLFLIFLKKITSPLGDKVSAFVSEGAAEWRKWEAVFFIPSILNLVLNIRKTEGISCRKTSELVHSSFNSALVSLITTSLVASASHRYWGIEADGVEAKLGVNNEDNAQKYEKIIKNHEINPEKHYVTFASEYINQRQSNVGTYLLKKPILIGTTLVSALAALLANKNHSQISSLAKTLENLFMLSLTLSSYACSEGGLLLGSGLTYFLGNVYGVVLSRLNLSPPGDALMGRYFSPSSPAYYLLPYLPFVVSTYKRLFNIARSMREMLKTSGKLRFFLGKKSPLFASTQKKIVHFVLFQMPSLIKWHSGGAASYLQFPSSHSTLANASLIVQPSASNPPSKDEKNSKKNKKNKNLKNTIAYHLSTPLLCAAANQLTQNIFSQKKPSFQCPHAKIHHTDEEFNNLATGLFGCLGGEKIMSISNLPRDKNLRGMILGCLKNSASFFRGPRTSFLVGRVISQNSARLLPKIPLFNFHLRKFLAKLI